MVMQTGGTPIALFSERGKAVRSKTTSSLMAGEAAGAQYSSPLFSPAVRAALGVRGDKGKAPLLKGGSWNVSSPSDLASPNVRAQEAMKEIICSPSPKVSDLVVQLRAKERRIKEEARERHAFEQQREEMLTKAEEVRVVRKRRAEEARAVLSRAEETVRESDSSVQAWRAKASAAALRSPGGGTDGTPSAEEAALRAAEERHAAALEEREEARCAAEAAEAEHQSAARVEEEALRVGSPERPAEAPGGAEAHETHEAADAAHDAGFMSPAESVLSPPPLLLPLPVSLLYTHSLPP